MFLPFSKGLYLLKNEWITKPNFTLKPFFTILHVYFYNIEVIFKFMILFLHQSFCVAALADSGNKYMCISRMCHVFKA